MGLLVVTRSLEVLDLHYNSFHGLGTCACADPADGLENIPTVAGSVRGYPLVICDKHGPVELVSFPINHGDFP